MLLEVSLAAVRPHLRRAFGNSVKYYLTDCPEQRLLCVGGWCNLITVELVQLTEYAIMNTIALIARFGQAAFAVMVTTASVLVFQFALLAG